MREVTRKDLVQAIYRLHMLLADLAAGDLAARRPSQGTTIGLLDPRFSFRAWGRAGRIRASISSWLKTFK